MNEACRNARTRLSEYHDGELEASVSEAISRHVSECAECRAILESYRTQDEAIAGDVPVLSETEWEGLAGRIDSAVTREPRGGAADGRPTPTWTDGLRGFFASLSPKRLAFGSLGTIAVALLVVLLFPEREAFVPQDEIPIEKPTDVFDVDAKRKDRRADGSVERSVILGVEGALESAEEKSGLEASAEPSVEMESPEQAEEGEPASRSEVVDELDDDLKKTEVYSVPREELRSLEQIPSLGNAAGDADPAGDAAAKSAAPRAQARTASPLRQRAEELRRFRAENVDRVHAGHWEAELFVWEELAAEDPVANCADALEFVDAWDEWRSGASPSPTAKAARWRIRESLCRNR